MPIIITQNPGMFSQDHEDAPYDYFTTKTTYKWNSGKKQLPIAKADVSSDPPQPFQFNVRQRCAIVQVCAPYGWKLVQWAAQRAGEHPSVPSPEPSTDNFVLLDGACVVDPPLLIQDAETHLYRAHGYYLFAMLKPFWFRDGLPMGRTPYDESPDEVFGVFDFDENLD